MRKGTLLNGPLTALVGDLGHSDKIMIVDAGWPIPADLRLDLCLTHGIPRLTQVFATVAQELSIERVIIDARTENSGEIPLFKTALEALPEVAHVEITNQRGAQTTTFTLTTTFKPGAIKPAAAP